MTTETQAGEAKKPGTLAALAVYLERRSLVMLSLGFASGLPNLLICGIHHLSNRKFATVRFSLEALMTTKDNPFYKQRHSNTWLEPIS